MVDNSSSGWWGESKLFSFLQVIMEFWQLVARVKVLHLRDVDFGDLLYK